MKKRPGSSKTQAYGRTASLALLKFDQLDELMTKDLDFMKGEIQKLKVEDYMKGSRSIGQLHTLSQLQAKDMPLKILDSLIDHEQRG